MLIFSTSQAIPALLGLLGGVNFSSMNSSHGYFFPRPGCLRKLSKNFLLLGFLSVVMLLTVTQYSGNYKCKKKNLFLGNKNKQYNLKDKHT